MNFTKTTEYAFRILSYMAKDESHLYNANELYENLKIPFRYLRKQLTLLSKAGLLISEQGKNGGYKIAKDLTTISLLDIVHATGANISGNACFFGFSNCALAEKCAIHDKWASIYENVNNVLISTNLAEFRKITNHEVLITNNKFINFKKD
jgi:Rrf2 family nitric oxide-sensitive transcriptional repressor